jgi:hypothetical protein
MRGGKSIFSGTFLLSSGAVLFLSYLNINIKLDFISSWWPIILIILGFAYTVNHKIFTPLLSGSAGLMFALAVFGGTSFLIGGEKQELKYSAPFNSRYRQAVLKVDTGVGTFDFTALPDKENLILIEGESTLDYLFQTKKKDERVDLLFKPENDGDFIQIPFLNIENTFDIKLNKQTEWHLEVNVGAVSSTMDLSNIRLGTIEINSGASSMHLKLGNILSKSEIKIEAGASLIKIKIPEKTGASIKFEGGLFNKDVRGFEKIEENEYESRGFDEWDKKIFMEINAGASDIKVETY